MKQCEFYLNGNCTCRGACDYQKWSHSGPTVLCTCSFETSEKEDKSTFTLMHPNMIDLKEIRKSLSRKKPLLFIEYSGMVFTYIHNSISWKANILNIPNTLPYSFQIRESALKRNWVQHVKKIKSAKWGRNKQKTKVKMIFPKI